MKGTLVVDTPQDYQAWLKERAELSGGAQGRSFAVARAAVPAAAAATQNKPSAPAASPFRAHKAPPFCSGVSMTAAFVVVRHSTYDCVLCLYRFESRRSQTAAQRMAKPFRVARVRCDTLAHLQWRNGHQ
jgi:hypothetical protein